MKKETIKVLLKNRKAIHEAWLKILLENDYLKEGVLSNEDLRVQTEELIVALTDAFQKGSFEDLESVEYEDVVDVITGLSLSRAKQGYSPRETGMLVLSLKTAFINFLRDTRGDDLASFFDEVLVFNKLIDNLSILTFETYIKGREEVILRQTDEIEEISTPVIKVWEGIVALPIIGTLDSSRTQVVMENLLNEIVTTGSSIAILDISGVPTVDSLVAQHLIKTVNATRLMGAECIISGIKPEIAQTIVHLGIDLSDIYTKASLANALKFAFQKLRLKVVNAEN